MSKINLFFTKAHLLATENLAHNKFLEWEELKRETYAEIKGLQDRLSTVEALLYEFSNNPNIELGEKGHAKIDDYFGVKEQAILKEQK